MSKKENEILEKGLYEIAFNERDREIKQVELMRAHIEADLEEAMAEYIKAGGSKKLRKKSKKIKVSPLALDGADPRTLI